MEHNNRKEQSFLLPDRDLDVRRNSKNLPPRLCQETLKALRQGHVSPKQRVHLKQKLFGQLANRLRRWQRNQDLRHDFAACTSMLAGPTSTRTGTPSASRDR
jgi:hypothetical protein